MAFTKVTNAGIGSTGTVLLHNLNVVGTVTATDGIFSGIGSFGGNVSVGGTLTYEDVTNIDSVGLITARNGINVIGAGVTIRAGGLNVTSGVSTFSGNVTVGTGITLSPDGDGYYTGVVTATSYKGDGSGLTGIDATQILTGNTSVQTVDTGSDGHVKITTEGTERGRFDATGLFTMNGKASLGKTATGVPFAIGDSGTGGDKVLHFKRAATTNDINIQAINSGSGATNLLLNSEGGNVLTGHTAVYGSGLSQIFNTTQYCLDLSTWSADANGPTIDFYKSRNATKGSATIVQNGDVVGRLRFLGNDGANARTTAQITAESDGTPGTNDMPGRLVFSTTRDGASSSTEALRIDCRGYLMINGDTNTYLMQPAADTWAMVMAGSECFRWDNTHFGIGTQSIAGHHMSIHQGNSSEALIRFTNTSTGEGTGNGVYIGLSSSEELELRNVENAGASLYTNNTQRLHINNDGDVWFDRSVDGAHTVYIRNMSENSTTSSATTNIIDFKFNRSGGGINLSAAKIIVGKEQEWVGGAGNQDGYICWHTALNESASEKMRLSSGGNLMIGTTTASEGANTDEGVAILPYGSIVCRRDSTMYVAKSLATGGYTALKILSAQTQVGSISFNSGGTSFNTSSDYRRKENVIDLTGAITRLKTLKPKRFNFISNPSVTLDGFLAHEVTAVPESVWGTKDAVEPEDDEERDVKKDDPIYQQLDQSKLVPLLTAALQEAIAKIETLETEVAALKSA